MNYPMNYPMSYLKTSDPLPDDLVVLSREDHVSGCDVYLIEQPSGPGLTGLGFNLSDLYDTPRWEPAKTITESYKNVVSPYFAAHHNRYIINVRGVRLALIIVERLPFPLSACLAGGSSFKAIAHCRAMIGTVVFLDSLGFSLQSVSLASWRFNLSGTPRFIDLGCVVPAAPAGRAACLRQVAVLCLTVIEASRQAPWQLEFVFRSAAGEPGYSSVGEFQSQFENAVAMITGTFPAGS